MAYYKVTRGGESFVNNHLCQVANKLGPTGISRAVSDGTFKQTQFFDSILYSIEDAQKPAYNVFEELTWQQDVDARIKLLVSCEEESAQRIHVPKAACPKLFSYGGFDFIRFSEVGDSSKYRVQDRMATLHVCGYIYVALNAKVTTETSPVIVIIKD
jgi:hypothetical protein